MGWGCLFGESDQVGLSGKVTLEQRYRKSEQMSCATSGEENSLQCTSIEILSMLEKADVSRVEGTLERIIGDRVSERKNEPEDQVEP